MHARVWLMGLALAAPTARAQGDEEAAKQAKEQMLAACGYAQLPVKVMPEAPGVLECDRNALGRVEMPLGRRPDGSMRVERVEGEVTRFNFAWPAGTSFLDVSSYYEGALREAGFQLVYPARGADLGFVSARQGNTWVLVEPFGGGSQVTLVKGQAQEDTPLTGAAAMREALEREGRVVVPGLDFTPGKATLAPGSQEALAEVRRLLQDDGALALRIESHSDDAGKPRDNLALSKKRAAAVKAWLVKQGVAPARLQAEGVAGSATAAGRRVELVKR
jgi:outer membrane protein OmpA-like peptidoglycan-associated protein